MLESEREAIVTRLRDRLLSAALPGGGWGYAAAKAPRIEPTAWALLALSPSGLSAADSYATPHLSYLKTCQQTSGLLLELPRLIPNFTANGTAACVLIHANRADTPSASQLVAGLLTVKGLSVNEPDPRQNNRLQAWPWLPETFSWIEPTCWCTLALKQWRLRAPGPAVDARVNEAEELLINRACDIGGWNYGNASALGQDLRPYVPTTALGLLALQDRLGDAAPTRALLHLDKVRLSEPSGMALSLAMLALRICGKTVDDVEDRLGGDVARIERQGNLQTLAMTLYALTASTHQARLLRV